MRVASLQTEDGGKIGVYLTGIFPNYNYSFAPLIATISLHIGPPELGLVLRDVRVRRGRDGPYLAFGKFRSGKANYSLGYLEDQVASSAICAAVMAEMKKYHRDVVEQMGLR